MTALALFAREVLFYSFIRVFALMRLSRVATSSSPIASTVALIVVVLFELMLITSGILPMIRAANSSSTVGSPFLIACSMDVATPT